MSTGQTYVERLPPPALSGIVRTVWVQSTGGAPYLQRNLPTGGAEIHCVPGAVPRLIGPLTTALPELLPPGTTVIGARLRPGALGRVCGVPATALLDRVVPLDELWGTDGERLAAAIGAAPDPVAALRQLKTALRERAAARPADRVVAAAVARLSVPDAGEIASLADDLALSGSALRRRMLQSVGTGPKVLQRTLRFQAYLALTQRAGSARAVPLPARFSHWAEVAGYADHPHLTRECRRLSGLNPTELLHGRDDRCACGHEHIASFGPLLARADRLRGRAA
ncbi:AraC family transcriptional regulator [Nakamurella sp. YIM 132087]|uniref:AraC family transcriptional regulator n=1 Tax=Nakamurella alba TaxID=2665158 RepID=A0A7K1FKJ7_9ACTN|nr:DUF6597 domain-containing transcriptional factor [Nakamurella alba]MTD14590.1 AraC family transcriptional regulator [Nakamurella alba]